mmetsp:Transcript_31200/g.73689  ORF Transcript_31200/g.73689 Transcript_31200/m.73689 type:complete len:263 (+) Transcript_31200:968-1756(+)
MGLRARHRRLPATRRPLLAPARREQPLLPRTGARAGRRQLGHVRALPHERRAHARARPLGRQPRRPGNALPALGPGLPARAPPAGAHRAARQGAAPRAGPRLLRIRRGHLAQRRLRRRQQGARHRIRRRHLAAELRPLRDTAARRRGARGHAALAAVVPARQPVELRRARLRDAGGARRGRRARAQRRPTRATRAQLAHGPPPRRPPHLRAGRLATKPRRLSPPQPTRQPARARGQSLGRRDQPMKPLLAQGRHGTRRLLLS